MKNPDANVFTEFLIPDENILWTGRPEVSFALYARIRNWTIPNAAVGAAAILIVVILLFSINQVWGVLALVLGILFIPIFFLNMHRSYRDWYPHSSIYAVTNWRVLFRVGTITAALPIALCPYLRLVDTPTAPHTIWFALPESLRVFSIPDAESVFRLISDIQAGRFAGGLHVLEAGMDDPAESEDVFAPLLAKNEKLVWRGEPKPPEDRWNRMWQPQRPFSKLGARPGFQYGLTDQRVLMRWTEEWMAFPLTAIHTLHHVPDVYDTGSIEFNVGPMTLELLPRQALRMGITKALLTGDLPRFDQLQDGTAVFRRISQLQHQALGRSRPTDS